MFKTRITEMFGIETPLIMGGMTGVGYGELVAAVANANAVIVADYDKGAFDAAMASGVTPSHRSGNRCASRAAAG